MLQPVLNNTAVLKTKCEKTSRKTLLWKLSGTSVDITYMCNIIFFCQWSKKDEDHRFSKVGYEPGHLGKHWSNKFMLLQNETFTWWCQIHKQLTVLGKNWGIRKTMLVNFN